MNNNVVNDLTNIASLFNLYKVLFLILGFMSLYFINKLARSLFDQLMIKLPGSRFTVLQIATLFSFVVYIIGSFALVIGVLNPPKEFLYAAGGSMAVAVGIALKDVVASVIAGLVLLFDRPFIVGDRVNFDGSYGEIISIGLRSVRLQTLDDNTITIPNARFMNEMVSSGNAGALEMMVVCDFHVALTADVQQAIEIIREVIVTSRYAYLKKPINFSVSEVEVAQRLAIQIKAKAYVLDIRYEKAFQSDIVSRTTQLFIEQQVQRPVFGTHI
ncbi:MAG: mechanosensitive ion channel protein [Gammaproteobacteria bacterium]|nr:MAG: mechanosensitive ion channel protein [Gammaproteobacteria bacterium]